MMLAERFVEARGVLARAEKSYRRNAGCLAVASNAVLCRAFGGLSLSRNVSIGGIASVGLHEVICAHDGAGASVLAWYLANLTTDAGMEQVESKPVFWVRQRKAIDQGRFYHLALPASASGDAVPLMMTVDQQEKALWACEEAAKSGQIASIILETTDYSLTAARRLQLACEGAGTRMIVLRRGSASGRLMPSSALTRWKIEPALDAAQDMTGNIHHLSLIGGRGVRPGSWKVKTDATTFSLSVVDPLENRLPPSEPEGRRIQT